MKYILRIQKSIFQLMPFSASITVLDYLYGAFVPALATLVSVRLFDSAAQVLTYKTAVNSLILYAGLYLGIYLLNDFLLFFRSITLNAGIYEKGSTFFRIHLYEKLARLPLITFEDAAMLNKKARAEKAIQDETLSGLCNYSFRLIRAGIRIASLAALLATYNIWLLPLAFLSALPYLFARLIRGKEFYHVKKHQARKNRLLAYLWSLFSSQQAAKEMRVMGFASYLTDKWQATRDEVNEELWAVQKKDALSLLLCDGLRILGYCASILLVLLLTLHGQVTIGVFAAAIAAFLSLQDGTQDFLQSIAWLTDGIPYAEDYYSFLDQPEEASGKSSYPGLQQTIELENISFSYPNSQSQALKQLNLTIHQGEKIAIVGENGSGKTTLVKILLGLYPPEQAQVLYDGRPVTDFCKDSLYAGISALAQDFLAYKLTLRENLAISDSSRLTDDPGLAVALEQAGLAGLMELDDVLGREFGGKELSGGQWQKVALARSLFKDSQLLILDEPTSALDPLIEAEILANFITAAQGKTALIISHRFGLCQLVDRVIVMQAGQIVQDGSHAKLLATGGEYARLYQAQAQWYQ